MTEKSRLVQHSNNAEFDYRLHWQINQRCNFDCPYCFRRDGESRNAEHPDCAKYAPVDIARRFDDTGRIWQIYMTGGEPLLYPRFVELAHVLTHRHYIALSTNLSTSNACEFADAVPAKRVAFIKTTLHPTDREKAPGELAEFFRKCLYFQQKGFDIRLAYVAYPPLFDRIERDFARCRTEGINCMEVKTYQGRYDGKRYPRDYTGDQRELMRQLGLNERERQILDSRVSFLGRICAAGRTGYAMDISGNVTRCLTLHESHGNLFEGTFHPGTSSRRCSARTCACAYQGFALTGLPGSLKPGNIIARPVRSYIKATESITHLAAKMR